MGVEVECDSCGEITEKWPSEIKRRENIYCSRECSAKSQTKGEHLGDVPCDVCGDPVDRSPSQIHRNGAENAYCSQECASEAKRSVENPTDVECAGCGETFTIPEARVGFDNFCSDECEERYGLDCPKSGCERDGFKSLRGVKMHYTRTHGERFDTARLEEKYGVPVDWLLRTLHWTLAKPVDEMAEELDVGRRWLNGRLDEIGCGFRGVQESATYRMWNGSEKFTDAVRNALGEQPWHDDSQQKRDEVGECRLCGTAEADTTRLNVHHIVPVMCGGTNEDYNYMVVCPSCHRKTESYTRAFTDPVLLPEDRRGPGVA